MKGEGPKKIWLVSIQEISNRTHVSRTPKKPEYLIARSQLTERGPLGFGPIQFLMDSTQRSLHLLLNPPFDPGKFPDE